jgi:hypothetical protein
VAASHEVTLRMLAIGYAGVRWHDADLTVF